MSTRHKKSSTYSYRYCLRRLCNFSAFDNGDKVKDHSLCLQSNLKAISFVSTVLNRTNSFLFPLPVFPWYRRMLRANGRADIIAVLDVDSSAKIDVTESKAAIGVTFKTWLAIGIG